MFQRPEMVIMLAAQIVVSVLYLVALMRYTRANQTRKSHHSTHAKPNPPHSGRTHTRGAKPKTKSKTRRR